MQMNSLILIIIKYKYAVLFPFAAFEGPVLAVVIGVLIHEGYLLFLPSYLILILGDVIPDTIYYYLGRLGKHKKLIERYGSKLKVISGNFHLVEKLWKDHPRKTMFLSKLAYGLSTPFLISAGLVKMPFRKFISLTIPITLIQYAFFLTLGYYLGQSYTVAEKYIKYGGLLIALALVLFIAGYIYLSKYARNQLKELDEKENTENGPTN